MKEAQSMRYGGLFVAASECDYTSFKHQGLLCPICKKSVFLVAGSERSPHQRTLKDGSVRDVKQAKIDAYFAHHPDTEKSLVEACELRSTQITQAQKALVAAQSRGQRQKALQAHCWKILKTSIKLEDIDTTPKLLYSYWERATEDWQDKQVSRRMYQLYISNLCDQFRLPSQITLTKEDVGMLINHWFINSQDSSLLPSDMHPFFVKWRSQLDHKMQEAITCEVIDFISQIRQTPILSTLIENAVYNLALVAAGYAKLKMSDASVDKLINHVRTITPAKLCDKNMEKSMSVFLSELIRFDAEQFKLCFQFVCKDVIQSIVFTDWAGEFQRLENLELSRSK